MYIDSIVLYGLVIVALTCSMITYVGVYAYKHIKEDSARADQRINNNSQIVLMNTVILTKAPYGAFVFLYFWFYVSGLARSVAKRIPWECCL